MWSRSNIFFSDFHYIPNVALSCYANTDLDNDGDSLIASHPGNRDPAQSRRLLEVGFCHVPVYEHMP